MSKMFKPTWGDEPGVAKAKPVWGAKPQLDHTKLYEWQGPFEKWSRLWTEKHYWRVRNVVPTKEDALQECALVFAKVVNRYAALPDMEPRWMMALYKSAITNHWNNLSVADTGAREVIDFRVDADELPAQTVPPNSLGAKIAMAGEEVRHALSTLVSLPAEMLDLVLGEHVPNDRDTINTRLKRVTNQPQSGDLLGKIEEALS